MEKISKLFKQIICFFIVSYQFLIKPVLRPSCRFYPSCSQYALLAVQHYGAIKGLKMIFGRLLRCHPWCSGGYDPVLPTDEKH